MARQPSTLKAQLGWRAARLLAASGSFRFFPFRVQLPHEVASMMEPYYSEGYEFAVGRSNHPGRFITLVLDGNGSLVAVAKIATTEDAQATLERERVGMATMSDYVAYPLSVPKVMAHTESLLLLEAIDWQPRRRPWRLPSDVAGALGTFFRCGSQGGDSYGFAHGDFAPWNLLRNGDRWWVIDWEQSRSRADPFHDLFHYLVQSHVCLGRPSAAALSEGLSGRGWIGQAIAAYALSAHLQVGSAASYLSGYLRTSTTPLRLTAEDERAFRIRTALADAIGSAS